MFKTNIEYNSTDSKLYCEETSVVDIDLETGRGVILNMSITCSILASIFTRLGSGSRLIDNVVARGGRGLCVMGLGGCDMVQTVEEFGRRSALGIGRPQTSLYKLPSLVVVGRIVYSYTIPTFSLP